MYYDFEYEGIKRRLPVYGVGGGLSIAYLDTFSDLELVNALSNTMAEFIQNNPDYRTAERVVILTAVSKGVPFAYTVANELLKADGAKSVEIAIARKENKKFYGETISVDKFSITSEGQGDVLYLAENDVKKLNNSKVIILDDMYSTGASVTALENLAKKCNAQVIEKVVAVWEADDEKILPPVKYAATLPLIK